MRSRALLLLLAIAVIARADDTATARIRFQEGVELYDKGQYDKARAAFLQAWALKKHPAILLNLGQSCLKSGRPGEAARDFAQLVKDPSGLTAVQKTEAEKGLAEARAKAGRIDVQTAAGGEISIDGERIGVAPLDPIDVEPGAHTVRVKGEEQKVNATVGQTVAVRIGPPPTAAAAPAPTTSTSTSTTAAPPPGPPDESLLGGAGESCRSRADCKTGLKCVDHTCLDQNAKAPEPGPENAQPETAPSEWMSFRLEGVHPFAGLNLMGGPAIPLFALSGRSITRNANGSFQLALRGGVFVGRTELALELAPFTYLPYSTDTVAFAGAAFSVMGTVGHFIPLHEGTVSLYWPLRGGVGLMAGGHNTGDLAYFEARADLVGVALRIGHLVLDFMAPSFRYAVSGSNGTTVHLFSWHFGGNISYVF